MDETSVHPSSIACLQKYPTTSTTGNKSNDELPICGLEDEYGYVCKTPRTPQNESKTPDGNIRCHGCRMIRTPLGHIENEFQIGKLQIAKGKYFIFYFFLVYFGFIFGFYCL